MILGKFKETLNSHGPKALIGNKGFARFLKVARGSATIDDKAVRTEEKLDGQHYLLRTSLQGAAHEAFYAAGV